MPIFIDRHHILTQINRILIGSFQVVFSFNICGVEKIVGKDGFVEIQASNFVARKKIKTMKKKRILHVVAIALVMTAVIATGALVFKNNDNTIVVTIKGNIKNVSFNGQRQSAIGYTVETNSDLYTADDFVCYATDSVSAVNAGTYSMGISDADFCNVNPNYKDVVFVVVDGCLSISDDQTDNKSSLIGE